MIASWRNVAVQCQGWRAHAWGSFVSLTRSICAPSRALSNATFLNHRHSSSRLLRQSAVNSCTHAGSRAKLASGVRFSCTARAAWCRSFASSRTVAASIAHSSTRAMPGFATARCSQALSTATTFGRCGSGTAQVKMYIRSRRVVHMTSANCSHVLGELYI